MTDMIDLAEIVNAGEWLVGAINYDEDLHFSSYYLRASTPQQTIPHYPGYRSILAFYEDFTERYYLRRAECVESAETLVKKAVADPDWLGDILDTIVEECNELDTVFPSGLTPMSLSRLDIAEIIGIYNKHHRQHSSLYGVARVPEALDRGVNYFTNYLRSHLETLGVHAEQLDDTFNRLTQPVSASVLAQYIIDFDQLLLAVRRDRHTRELMAAFPQKARIMGSHHLMEHVREFTSKWKYLEYHGYGSRVIPDEGATLEKLVVALREEKRGRTGRGVLQHLYKNEREKEAEYRRLRIDRTHRKLFDVYPRIGSVKLTRRYAQIKNFYFLDILIADIARRLRIDEWTVRSMLPEEIRRALNGDRHVVEEARLRRSGCMIVFQEGRERFVTGDDCRRIRDMLDRQAAPHRDRRVLKGVIASQGRVQGTCKIVIRTDASAKQFQKGAILVSEATDPDLLKFLQIAGGVLTQQGGVTAHAAIICREIGIPAIIGIEGLLDTVKDGDVVQVDAFNGTVTLLSDEAVVAPGLLVAGGDAADAAVVGSKAVNLGRLRGYGFNVPPFVTLRFELVEHYVNVADASQRADFTRTVQQALEVNDRSTLAIRSSATAEDLEDQSLAGEFESVLDVSIGDLWQGLEEFCRRNAAGKTGLVYRGGVIVQVMARGDVGGVCLTADGSRTDIAVCEISARGADEVTAGRTTPGRLRFQKETGDIVESSLPPELQPLVTEIFPVLLRTCQELERRFGSGVDIEWTCAAGLFHVLQVRPIVKRPRGLRRVT